MKIRSILLLLCLPLFLSASYLTDRYPSYRYVFSEFDVESGYIYDPEFEMFAKRYETSLKHFYRKSLKRGEGMLSMVRGELLEDGLSDLFLYLSIVESGLSTDIKSSKKAAGLWQFMPKTAKYYNLQVCNGIDERCDPFISTRAAIRHLRSLYRKFGKWYLAVMAYNCGEGRLSRAIKQAGSDELSVLTDDQRHYLPAETRNYIRKILLVAMIGENEMIDFASGTHASDLLQVEVSGGVHLEDIAQRIGMDPRKLKSLNRQFKSGRIPQGDSYAITIPEAYLAAFFLKYDIEQTEKEDTTETIKPHLLSHVVVLGDTLETIARRYHTTAAEIKRANRLESDALTAGAILVIPIAKEDFERLLETE